MEVGEYEHEGDVIREYRERAELAIDTIAEVSGVDAERLRRIEDGEVAATMAELRKLSGYLRVDLPTYDPEGDAPPDELPPLKTLLRAAEQYASRSAWPTILECAEVAHSIVMLEQWLELPNRFEQLRRRFLPSEEFEPKPHVVAKALARKVRADLALGNEPVPSVREVSRRLGIAVIETWSLPAGIAALALADAYHGPTVVLNGQASDSILVERYTLAHELCHVLFDRHKLAPWTTLDPPQFFASHKPLAEVRADAFGIHFLAPEERVRAMWTDSDDRPEERIREIIEVFGVSKTASISAALNWNLIDADRARRLSDIDPTPTASLEDTERDATANEAFDAIPRERRGRLLRLTLRARAEGVIGRSKAIELLDVDGETFDANVDRWRQLVAPESTEP